MVVYHKRLKAILDNEKIDYDDKVLAELIIKHYKIFVELSTNYKGILYLVK